MQALVLWLQLGSRSPSPPDQGLPIEGTSPGQVSRAGSGEEPREAGELRVDSHFQDNDASEKRTCQWPVITPTMERHH